MPIALLNKLETERRLSFPEWVDLLRAKDVLFTDARLCAQKIAKAHFGNEIVYRGIVECTNICKNDCLYCGIRKGNHALTRYRLNAESIIAACAKGYEEGVRTFVLQGGEDPLYTDDVLVPLIHHLTERFPEARVTLSLGERSRESYERLFQAGARRYLLRHETASLRLYAQLHPPFQHFWQRMTALYNLKAIGYQTGCGMMVGAPMQTREHLAEDFCFLQDFHPHMVGVGPFLSHRDTPFKNEPNGDAKLTLYVLALIRILLPNVLLPATTALQTLLSNGYQEGIKSGCNVIMPNMTPQDQKGNYLLYDHKPISDSLQEAINAIKRQVESIGYTLESKRLDYKAME